jgi:hypothetical protein
MPHVYADEVRPLDFGQQRKRARELQRALRNGEPGAVQRFRAVHPKSTGLTDAQIVQRLAKLTESQLVIARELGLASWPKLRRHIERLAAARAQVAAGAPVLDADLQTMHIRCGTDIRGTLRRAGFHGRFIEFNDPYCQGPVPRAGDLIDIRAHFIADAYGLPLELARDDLIRAHSALHDSMQSERVVLWFEHDSFDQLILARILAFYNEHGAPQRLDLVHIDRFPAVPRFKGLGELSAAALRMLWDDRVRVTPAVLALGSRVWDALRDPAPLALFDAVRSSQALPRLGTALLRHLRSCHG